VDVIGDVLATRRIGGTVLCRSRLHAPWGYRFDAAPRAGLHLVERGGCWLRVDGEPTALRLGAGDLVLLPHGVGHSLSSDLEIEPQAFACSIQKDADARFSTTGAGASTALLCGGYRFERDEHPPLLSMLPPVIHLAAADRGDDDQIDATLRLLLAEHDSDAVGASATVARLVDLLFIFAVRSWLDRGREIGDAWIDAMRDPQLGRALAALHTKPELGWTTEQLAATAGMSRASFARRFKQLVGEPPHAYLTRWRMDVAARLLRDTDLTLARIAERAGYRSEFSFNRAFSRSRGTPPGRYREQLRAPPSVAA